MPIPGIKYEDMRYKRTHRYARPLVSDYMWKTLLHMFLHIDPDEGINVFKFYVIPETKVKQFEEYLKTWKNRPKEIEKYYHEWELISDELIAKLYKQYKESGEID